MKNCLFVLICLLSFIFSGCLEIEQGIILNNDGSGKMALKTDMSQIMAMLSAMGKDEKISKDTVINYKSYLDTAKSLTTAEKELVSKASWHLRMNSDEGIFDLTLKTDFKDLKEIDQLLAILARWDNSNIMGDVFKDMTPQGSGMDDMGMGGGNKDISDMTKDYFKTDWQNGKLTKTLDTIAYKKINEDENLNSFKQLGALAGGGGGVDEMLGKINVTTKFMLPRPAKKAEGKNLKLSDDKKTVTVICPVSDIYTAPRNFEYKIEY